MRVKIVSNTKQYFDGYNWWRDKRGGYYKNAQVKPHSLHRYVWTYHYGEIPKGLVVDHIDRNKNNNQIENLRLVTQSENAMNQSPETKLKRKEWADKIRPLTVKWHKSLEGKEWHKKQATESFKKRLPRKIKCAHCGKEFYTKQYSKRTRFCSENCQMKARRRRLKGLPEDYGSLR